MDYNNRSEIKKEYTWDLTTRYKNDKSWEEDYSDLKKQVNNISKYQNKLNNPKDIYACLEEYYDIQTRLTKLFIYASLKLDEDLKVSKYGLYLNKAYSLYNDFISLSSYIMPELLKISKEEMQEFLKEDYLKKYAFLLNDLMRYKDHTLNASEEKIVSILTSENHIFDKINSTLLNSTLNYGKIKIDGKLVEITNSNYRNIMMNKDQNIRKKCYKLMTKKISEYLNIFGDVLISNMKNTSNYAKVKNYDSTMSMELFTSNIPKDVVTNLYDTVHKRLDVFQKYLIFIKNNLKLECLNYYDLSCEYTICDKTFNIEEAKDLIINATKIYGEDYNNVIKKAFNERWIDFGSYKGKRSGAYCTANYGNNPVVLTNYHGKFTDVSAVAHELGHAVNFYLSMQKNDAHNYENDIFVAEVASLTNEIILSNYIINNSDDKNLKLAAIANLIDIIQNNLFDACLEGELENEMYKLIDSKEEIDANTLSDCIKDLRRKYYGKEVKLDKSVRYLWARRSHYFMPFYLYQYATGVSAAINVATKIINNDESFKKKYIDFLGKGSTDYPINLLNALGIDMTKPEVINNAINYFDYLIDLYSKVSDE